MASRSKADRLAAIAEDGLISGIIGALTVAIFFLIVDALSGRPLFTPSLLGSVLFLGESAEDVREINVYVVIAYTALHMALFIGAGLAAAYAVSLFETRPHLGSVLLVLFVCFEASFLGLCVLVMPGVIGVLGSVMLAVGNLISAAAMATFLLWWRHPVALRNLGHVSRGG